MKQKIIPELCKQLDSDYEGYVVMRMPDYDERIELSESCSVAREDGDEEVPQTRVEKLKFMRNLVKRLPEFIVELKITRKSDGYVFDSIDGPMKYDSDMASVISELAGTLVGKHLVQPSAMVV